MFLTCRNLNYGESHLNFSGGRAGDALRRDLSRCSNDVFKKNPANEKGESLSAMNIVLWDVPNITRLVREKGLVLH